MLRASGILNIISSAFILFSGILVFLVVLFVPLVKDVMKDVDINTSVIIFPTVFTLALAVLPLGGGGSGGDKIASASGGRAPAASFSSIDGNNPNPTQVGAIFNLTAVG